MTHALVRNIAQTAGDLWPRKVRVWFNGNVNEREFQIVEASTCERGRDEAPKPRPPRLRLVDAFPADTKLPTLFLQGLPTCFRFECAWFKWEVEDSRRKLLRLFMRCSAGFFWCIVFLILWRQYMLVIEYEKWFYAFKSWMWRIFQRKMFKFSKILKIIRFFDRSTFLKFFS